jgi:hypothetical protein
MDSNKRDGKEEEEDLEHFVIQEHTNRSLEELGWREIFCSHAQNQNLKKKKKKMMMMMIWSILRFGNTKIKVWWNWVRERFYVVILKTRI